MMIPWLRALRSRLVHVLEWWVKPADNSIREDRARRSRLTFSQLTIIIVRIKAKFNENIAMDAVRGSVRVKGIHMISDGGGYTKSLTE